MIDSEEDDFDICFERYNIFRITRERDYPKEGTIQ